MRENLPLNKKVTTNAVDRSKKKGKVAAGEQLAESLADAAGKPTWAKGCSFNLGFQR